MTAAWLAGQLARARAYVPGRAVAAPGPQRQERRDVRGE